jgi:recombinational DNA repair protein (RecF pathway)
MYKCAECKKELDEYDAYEYRGAIACAEHLDSVTASRDSQRNEIIAEEDAKTRKLKGLDFGDNVIGKANKDLLKREIEISGKESGRLRDYEGRAV